MTLHGMFTDWRFFVSTNNNLATDGIRLRDTLIFNYILTFFTGLPIRRFGNGVSGTPNDRKTCALTPLGPDFSHALRIAPLLDTLLTPCKRIAKSLNIKIVSCNYNNQNK
jgi:hypothetical protein